jgi:hypothetical protein
VKPNIGNQNVDVVGLEIFNDLGRTVLDIDIPPVHPAVLWLHSRREQIVTGAPHSFPARSLSLEAMPVFHILRQRHAKVLFDDHGGPERILGVLLHALELFRQYRQRVVRAVSNQKREVDQLVRIRELAYQVKVLGEERTCVAEGCEDEHALLVDVTFWRGLDRIQVDVFYGVLVDLDRLVVVEDYGCSEMRMPLFVLILRHGHGRFGRTPAVESRLACQLLYTQCLYTGLEFAIAYLCISPAAEPIDRQSSKITDRTPSERSTRGFRTVCHNARVGGSRARAAFHE